MASTISPFVFFKIDFKFEEFWCGNTRQSIANADLQKKFEVQYISLDFVC